MRKYASDITLALGAGAITYGAWRIDPTAGIIAAGVMLLLAGIAIGLGEAAIAARRKSK